MFDTGAPASGDDHLAVLARLEAEGRAYLLGFEPASFFAAQGTAWSPAEHVRHLRRAAAAVTRGLRLPAAYLLVAYGWRRGPSRDFVTMCTVYQDALARGAGAGRFTPAPEAAPADPVARRNEILAWWSAAHAGLGVAVRRRPEARLDRYRLPHPLLGRLTGREILSFTVYHTAHHLRRVRERAETLQGTEKR